MVDERIYNFDGMERVIIIEASEYICESCRRVWVLVRRHERICLRIVALFKMYGVI
jgi:hypothetical protein